MDTSLSSVSRLPLDRMQAMTAERFCDEKTSATPEAYLGVRVLSRRAALK